MIVRFFNTMSRSVEEFKPISPGKAGLYTCGPTVYNYAHIGNFRAYTFEDLLRRTLKYCGYQVNQVMNLTDVDDKTIRDSKAAQIPLRDFTAKYKNAFFEDLKTLRIEAAEHYPAATDHVPEMINIIQTLFDKGFAYQAEDKSVYFSINKTSDYGKLAKIDRDNQISGVRIKNDEYAKDSVADFALWKAWDENDGDVCWDSPWGKGRPGWHIECSAMSMKYLGKTFDIHTGGIDNMFPHHEDEIAQSEAANGCTFVNYWLHCAHLIINGEKMSKSLGNFYTLRDLTVKGYTGRELRWVLLGAHYRSKLNFTFDACDQARMSLKRFQECFDKLKAVSLPGTASDETKTALKSYEDKFRNALADDLNISEAFASLFGLEKQANALMKNPSFNKGDAEAVLNQFRDFDRVMAVFDVDTKAESESIPTDVTELVQKRQDARKNKDFKTSDVIRDQLKALGWLVEDSPAGPKIKKI